MDTDLVVHWEGSGVKKLDVDQPARSARRRRERVVGYQAPSRDVLAAAFSVSFNMGNALEITLPCGNIRRYLTAADLPERSLRCRCGEVDYPHYFVFYTEEPPYSAPKPFILHSAKTEAP